MNANTGLFIFSTAIGFILGAVFTCWKYHRDGAYAALDSITGMIASFGGMALGGAIVLILFAFIAGKFSA